MSQRSPTRTAAATAAESPLRSLLDEVSEGVYFTDRQRRITFWNKAAERISGFSRAEVLGRNCSANILIHVDARGRQLCQGACPLAHVLQNGKPRQGNVFLHHRDGHRIPVRVRVFPLLGAAGKVEGAAELFVDISEKQGLEARLGQLEEMAMRDRLTGLANRRYSETYLKARLEEFRRFGWMLGIIFFDIDGFKQLNDRFSHRVGDRALRTVSRTLQHNLRSIDFVGRWGGEEFVLILRNIDLRHLKQIAEKLRMLVERSVFWVNGQAVNVTLSGGATLARPGDSRVSLIERADLLMYRSKRDGKNRVSFS